MSEEAYVLEDDDEWKRRIVPRDLEHGATLAEASYAELLNTVTANDVHFLVVRRRTYGDSWKKRGGVGAFMMLARKWDRIENIMEHAFGYDIFKACVQEESFLDDVRDLRRYLTLVEAELIRRMEIKLDSP
jgi:hypothetical protein